MSCTEAAQSANAPTGSKNVTVGELTFEGLSSIAAGLPAADVGLQVPTVGSPLYFLKVPIYLRAGAAAATIELANASAGFLAWVPADVWTSGDVDLTRWMASKVVFDGCPHQPSTYLGGLLSTDPHMCLVLSASQASRPGPHRKVKVGASARC